MRFSIRAYLLVLLSGLALVAGPEFLVRPYRGFERGDVSRIGASAHQARLENDAAGRGRVEGMDERLAAGLRRERAIRNAQTTTVLAIFAASVLFLVTNLREALRVRRTPR